MQQSYKKGRYLLLITTFSFRMIIEFKIQNLIFYIYLIPNFFFKSLGSASL